MKNVLEAIVMADFQSLISPRVTRIWKELFLLAFIISVGAIAILTFYYSRRPSRETYALSGGSGQLWLTVIAVSALGAFLIFAFDEREEKEWRRWRVKARMAVMDG